MKLECDLESINSYAKHGFSSACSYVEAACSDKTEVIDFIGLYYCTLNQNVYILIPMCVIIVAFTFNLIATTADRYLAPSLEVISAKLKLSEAIAGCTFLAFANGAADVLTGLVAGSKTEGGINIAIGGLFGALMFTITLVLVRCIQGAGEKGIDVEVEATIRDLGFMALGAIWFLFLALLGRITVPLASGFFVLYIVYVSYIVIHEYMRTNAESKKDSEKLKLLGTLHTYSDSPSRTKDSPSRIKSVRAAARWAKIRNSFYFMKKIAKKSRQPVKEERKSDANIELARSTSYNVTHETSVRIDGIESKQSIVSNIDDDEEHEPVTVYDWALHYYNELWFFIRDLTIPPFEGEHWNVYIASFTPIFGSLFLIWQFGQFETFMKHPACFAVWGPLAAACSAVMYYLGRKENLAEKYSGFFSIFGFVIAGMWIKLSAEIFIDMLSLVTIVSGLPFNYLSLTLLAWGNSMDDYFVDYTIAKKGFGKMAVVGCYAGQLFNLLIGFGGALFIQATKRNVVFNIFDGTRDNNLNLILIGSVLFCIVSTIIIAKIKKWHYGKFMKTYQASLYILFLIVVTAVTFLS